MKPSSIVIITLLMAATAGSINGQEIVKVGKATYFTKESCIREGNSGITASGKPLDDSKLWCALPRDIMNALNLKFEQIIKVTNTDTRRHAYVKLMDIGPGKKARSRGVVIDLTLTTFLQLNGSTNRGHINVSWQTVK